MTGPHGRRLSPSQAAAIAGALNAGVSWENLAGEYGVSQRTVYRAREYAMAQWTTVRVAGWRAEFAVTELGPIRMTAWYADSEAA